LGTTDIDFVAGQEEVLFTFENAGSCVETIQLMEAGDPFTPPNSASVNAGNEITVFGGGNDNSWSGNTGEVICDCNPETNIPTLGQWGLINLALLLVTFGAIKMTATRFVFSGATNISLPITNTFLPFDIPIFRIALKTTAVLTVIGFGICFTVYGAIFMPDILGMSLAGPIFAYLLHLVILIEGKQ